MKCFFFLLSGKEFWLLWMAGGKENKEQSKERGHHRYQLGMLHHTQLRPALKQRKGIVALQSFLPLGTPGRAYEMVLAVFVEERGSMWSFWQILLRKIWFKSTGVTPCFLLPTNILIILVHYTIHHKHKRLLSGYLIIMLSTISKPFRIICKLFIGRYIVDR